MKFHQKEDSAFEYFDKTPEEMAKLVAQSDELAAWIESLPHTLVGLKKTDMGYCDEWGNPIFWFPKPGRKLPTTGEIASCIRAAREAGTEE